VRHLAPIGWHCRSPHPRQAFHYGLHRALKKQNDVISRVAAVWLDQRDEARGWALAGAMSAGWRLRKAFDYGEARFEAAFARLADPQARGSRIESFARRKLEQAA
jgi:hypothetical protein